MKANLSAVFLSLVLAMAPVAFAQQAPSQKPVVVSQAEGAGGAGGAGAAGAAAGGITAGVAIGIAVAIAIAVAVAAGQNDGPEATGTTGTTQ